MRWRDHAIGAFVALHLCVALLVGLGPAPRGDAAPAGSVASAAADAWNTVRDPVRRVGIVYARAVGVNQGWRMFWKVNRTTTRLEIAVREGGQWRDVYVERSGTERWRRSTFGHSRWREYLNGIRGRRTTGAWSRFVPWVAREALADHPDADAVRVLVRKADVPPPKVLREQRALRFDEVVKSSVVPRTPDASP